MAGLDPAISPPASRDHRVKPGDDDLLVIGFQRIPFYTSGTG
jgi:hypothetical protein